MIEEYVELYDKYNKKIMNTYTDFGLLVQDLEIEEAIIKEEIIEVPYSDKILDFSEALTGDVSFKRRKIRIELKGDKKYGYREYLQAYSKIQNLIHGRELKIILSNDPSFFWVGKLSVKNIKPINFIREITIEAEVEPYKYDITSSTEDWIWDSFSFIDGIINKTKDLKVENELEVKIIGRRKKVVPVISCSNDMQVEFENEIYEIKQGKQKVLNVQIKEGENLLKFIGNGTVSIEYRGGSL